MSKEIYDVIIAGGGPAGLTAGIYTSRDRLNTLLIDKGICGGWLGVTDKIENYPGFPEGIAGMDLANQMKKQAQKFGTQINEIEEIRKINTIDGLIKVNTDKKEYSSKALIIATGTTAKQLNIPGEEQFIGKGVSYCATCDGPLFRDKTIVVIGGGNAACEEALFLTKFAKEVILIHRRHKFRAVKLLEEEVRNNKKIKLMLNHVPVSINGTKTVDSILVQEKDTKKQTKLDISGIFVFIGFLSNTKTLEGLIELDGKGYIKTNEKMETSQEGIYAIGDIRSKGVRQVATACGDGAEVALSIRKYLY